jgi:uncharacterized spore protein YtfJ
MIRSTSGGESELPPEELMGMTGEQVLDALAKRIGGHAHARMVYGEPVRHDGITVIPVAHVRWGFGIGSGFRNAPMRTGGGGAIASPVGYLEISDNRCRYVPIRERGATAGAVAGAVALLATRRLRRT